MAVTLGVIRETATDERRVALAPEVVKKLGGLGVKVLMEKGAGESAFLPDDKFAADNLQLADSAAAVLGNVDLVFKVQAPNADEIAQMREGTLLVAAMNPARNLDAIKLLKEKKITCWATEYIPRISRAQAMDTLSSQAAVAGYLGVLKAATLSSKFFPMLTTAAGTIRPSKVLVLERRQLGSVRGPVAAGRPADSGRRVRDPGGRGRRRGHAAPQPDPRGRLSTAAAAGAAAGHAHPHRQRPQKCMRGKRTPCRIRMGSQAIPSDTAHWHGRSGRWSNESVWP